MFATDFGESIRHVGGYSGASEYFDSNDTDEVDFKIKGGNSLLVDKLADAIRARSGSIRKGAEVTVVRQHGGEVSVELESGAPPANAHACVCAAPAPALRKIRWDPALPPDQWLAVNQLQYARIMKTAILYEQRFWPEPAIGGFSIVTNRDADFCFDSTHSQPGTQGILCSYAIGDKADDLATEPDKGKVAQWITEAVVGTIEGMAGQPSPGSPAPKDVKAQPWQLEGWVGGAWTSGGLRFDYPDWLS
jgi:monoamine oxidase